MSVEWLTWAYKQKLGDAGAKFVLITLCNYANPINPCDRQVMDIIPEALKSHTGKLGFAWPSQQLLADITEMGERTIRRHLCTLEERELILAFERRRPDGRKSSQGYLLITSPAILAAGTSPAKNDETSPANLAATYEDTQGLIQKDGIINSSSASSVKPPLPPFRISDHLKTGDWRAVDLERACSDGALLSRAYLVQQYDSWIASTGIEPRHPLQHFLDFIRRHKERNKA